MDRTFNGNDSDVDCSIEKHYIIIISNLRLRFGIYHGQSHENSVSKFQPHAVKSVFFIGSGPLEICFGSGAALCSKCANLKIFMKGSQISTKKSSAPGSISTKALLYAAPAPQQWF